MAKTVQTEFYRSVACPLQYRQWKPDGSGFDYANADCPYVGEAAFDASGNAVAPAEDRCGRTVADCRLRFGDGPLPFAGMPRVRSHLYVKCPVCGQDRNDLLARDTIAELRAKHRLSFTANPGGAEFGHDVHGRFQIHSECFICDLAALKSWLREKGLEQ